MSRKLEGNSIGRIQLYKDRIKNLSKSYALLAVNQKIKITTNEVNVLTSRYSSNDRKIFHSP